MHATIVDVVERVTAEKHLTDEGMARELRVPLSVLRAALQVLRRRGVLVLIDDKSHGWTWESRYGHDFDATLEATRLAGFAPEEPLAN